MVVLLDSAFAPDATRNDDWGSSGRPFAHRGQARPSPGGARRGVPGRIDGGHRAVGQEDRAERSAHGPIIRHAKRTSPTSYPHERGRSISDEPNARTRVIPDRNPPPQTALANASGSSASQTWKISTITRNAT